MQKHHWKILIIISIIILVTSIFFFFLNSYISHSEGIGLTFLYETDTNKILSDYDSVKIVIIEDEDLKDFPKIKWMLLMALEQELPLKKDGFELWDHNLNSYWFNQEGDGLRIQIALSDHESEKYEQWAWDHMLSPVIIEYQDRYFTFYTWIE